MDKIEKITSKKNKMDNIMRNIRIEKVVLSVAGTAEKLEKGVRLLKTLSGMQTKKLASKKRIPSFGVRPGLETGAKVTLRNEKIAPILKRLLLAVNNEIKRSQFVDNHFSFGIHEYIEIPGLEYQRDIGILGLNAAVDFVRAGKRVERKKIKRGKIPARQKVTREEIIDYMTKNYGIKLKEKKEK